MYIATGTEEWRQPFWMDRNDLKNFLDKTVEWRQIKYLDIPDTRQTQMPIVFLLTEKDVQNYKENALSASTAYWDLYDYLKAICGEPIGNGSRRITFSYDDEWVIKMPRYPGDEVYNITEANYYKSGKVSHAVCPCYLEHFMDVPLLWMQKVVRINFFRSIGLQEQFPMDTGQTGITKDGRIVYYDYDFPDRLEKFPARPVYPNIVSEDQMITCSVAELAWRLNNGEIKHV